MNISDAQKEVRSVHLGAFSGFIVTGLIWLISAAIGTWMSTGLAIWALILGGTFIYPLSTLLLKMMGRPASLSKKNPLGMLAMQAAFEISFCYPVIAAATIHTTGSSRPSWWWSAHITCPLFSYMACGSSAFWLLC